MKILTFVYIYLLLVDEYSDMEEEAGPQVGDAQKDKKIARKAEKENKREATVEMTITKEAPEKGKVSIWTNKVTAQEQNLPNF